MAAFHHPHPHHHQQNLQTTTSFCCCQTSPCHHQPPPLSPPAADPYVVAAIVSQLLQSPNPQALYSQHIKPTSINLSYAQNQRLPHQDSHQFHLHSPFFSLLQRIDALEASLERFSSAGSFSRFSLRDASARTIQVHFRAFLVHRSRSLRQLKDLASIKSALSSLKSSSSRHGFVDFDSLSHKAMDLLLKLDSIQSGDKMIKDSKKSVTREIVEFIELVDGLCVKRHQVLTRKIKNMRLVRNDNRGVHNPRGFSKHNVGPKSRIVSEEEKKLMANLRERVEKIGSMSKALQEQEQEVFGDTEIKGFNHDDGGEDDIICQDTTNYRLKNGLNIKNAQSSNAKKHVCFVNDGNLIRVYDIDGDPRSTARVVDVIEDSTKGTHNEEEGHSDGEGSSHSSEDWMKRGVSEECSNLDEEFTFSTTQPAKMDPRADFMSGKSGVKIAG